MSNVTGTIVFTDIVGFTEFTARYGDDRALELLERQEELVRSALPDGSRIVKQLGDGLLLFYDDVELALRTSLALVEQYTTESSSSGLPLWVRTGVHFGHPRRRGDDLIGHDVNLAARVADLAGPNEVLLTADALAEVSSPADLSFVELGPVYVKGIPDAIGLYRAQRLDATARH